MRRYAANFVIWVVAVITGLAIFTFVPHQSGWFWPLAIAWFVIFAVVIGILRSWVASIVRGN
jgi:hypothetical protein